MDAEINCFVDVNESKLNFMISVPVDVSFDEFQKAILPQLNAFSNPIRFSYVDEDGDRVFFESDMELKEALRFASTQEIFILNISAAEKVAKVDPVPIPVSIPVPVQAIPEPVKNNEVPNGLEALFENLKQEIPELVKELSQDSSIKEVTDFIVDMCNGEHMDEVQHFVKKIFPKEKKKVRKCKKSHKKQPVVTTATDEEPRKVIHNALCDYCNNRIQGTRFKCLQCPDYDLCEKCEEVNSRTNFHSDAHVFAKLYTPAQSVPAPSPAPQAPQCGMRFRGCPGGRFQRIVELENKVSNIEKDIAEIKALLINKNNVEVQNNDNDNNNTAVVQEEEAPKMEPIVPQPILSEKEENCKKHLEEMGIEIGASMISEYNCNIPEIVEHIM